MWVSETGFRRGVPVLGSRPQAALPNAQNAAPGPFPEAPVLDLSQGKLFSIRTLLVTRGVAFYNPSITALEAVVLSYPTPR